LKVAISKKVEKSNISPTFNETCAWKVEKNLLAVVKNLPKWTLNM
jgi:hypothetical protein